MIAKYTEKKTRGQTLVKFASPHVSGETLKRIQECGSWMLFLANKEVDKLKLHRMNSCKWKYCPMCNYRKSIKDAMRIAVMMDYIEKVYDVRFIFVTLTAPNVTADKLSDEITRYNAGFKRLTERDDVARMNLGYMRRVEVTYNKKTDTYHPHTHVVFAVNKSYFKSRDYLRQSKWLQLWRESMRDPTITQVDVRQVRRQKRDADKNKTENKNSSVDIVREFSKYLAKDADYGYSQEVFDVFVKALHKRRNMTYGGVFDKANKLYKEYEKARKAGEDHELDEYVKKDMTEYYYLLFFNWYGDSYQERVRRVLKEKERLNPSKMDATARTAGGLVPLVFAYSSAEEMERMTNMNRT